MLLRPDRSPKEVLRLLPLGLMTGALIGLLCGAVSAYLPILASLGPHFGRLATIWGAALGVLCSLTLLVLLRAWLLKQTAFHLGPKTLVIQWPGHRAQFEWSKLVGSEPMTTGILLRFQGNQSAMLFGLGDPGQAESLIRSRLQTTKRLKRPSIAA